MTRLGTQDILCLDQPLAILMTAVLHFIPDSDNPWSIVEAYKARMAPGSYLVISHITADDIQARDAGAAARIYEHASATATTRTRRDIERFFDGLDMLSPGLTEVSAWRAPHSTLRPALIYAGVARKPGHVTRRRGAL
jgi:hypothetical protein